MLYQGRFLNPTTQFIEADEISTQMPMVRYKVIPTFFCNKCDRNANRIAKNPKLYAKQEWQIAVNYHRRKAISPHSHQ